MRTPAPHDRVRLTRAISTLWLQCGTVGVVRSVWHSSPEVYEVEFDRPRASSALRALVRPEDLEVIRAAAGVAAVAGARS